MKVFFVSIAAIVCAAVLAFGNIHYNDKINTTVGAAQGKTDSVNPGSSSNSSDITSLISNWPKDSQKLFQKRQKENKPFRLLMVGSDTHWTEPVVNSLKETYKGIVVEVQQYELNSMEFIQLGKYEELRQEKADLILLEPFTLKDNGEVRSEDSFANINTIMDRVTQDKKDTAFILQPPNPLYNATYYPMQVAELKKFAKEKGITYMDHWTSWPDQKSEEMKGYLTSDGSTPSDNGYEVWSRAVTDFLINKVK
ncbi:SGNH/GDSL hydrolase family protein [Peribacillus sp. SCS-155]|uniref:SGNH/GDSL hydrolase family protein n=1 Tax=Peribacillus sedimenti TaxID=3115297 RepID=UPI003906BF0A